MFVLMCVCVRVFFCHCVCLCVCHCVLVFICVFPGLTSYKISREVRVPAVAKAVRS